MEESEYWNHISSGISGSAQGGFNASKLSALSVQIPPLPEQKRIVAILDEAFEAIDRAIANTEKNLANSRELFETIYRQKLAALNELKQSILQKAFTGELTVRLSSPTAADTPKTVKEEIAA